MIDTLLLYLHALSQPECVLLLLLLVAALWGLLELGFRMGHHDEEDDPIVWPDRCKRLDEIRPADRARFGEQGEALGFRAQESRRASYSSSPRAGAPARLLGGAGGRSAG